MDMEDCTAKVAESGLNYKVHNNGLLNVTDIDGIIQSYYTTKGTAIFRDGNDRFNSQRHTEWNMPFDRFLSLCKGDEDILTTFFD